MTVTQPSEVSQRVTAFEQLKDELASGAEAEQKQVYGAARSLWTLQSQCGKSLGVRDRGMA